MMIANRTDAFHPSRRGVQKGIEVKRSVSMTTFRNGLGFVFCVWVLLLSFSAPIHAQQVVQGVRGQADNHTVVNFRGIAELEKLGVASAAPTPNRAPMPLASYRTNGVPGGAFTAASSQGGVFTAAAGPAQPSPLPSANFLALESNLSTFTPDTHGAVGPNHIMTVLSSQVRIQDKAGTTLSTVALNTFWQTLGAPSVFFPKVLYDPYANRWMFTAAADASTTRSSVLLAVSQTSDPTGNWFLYRVDADRNDVDWADYPSIGFNKDWIVVSVNMFPILNNGVGFSGVNIYAFNKTNLYANSTAQFTLLRDGSSIGFNMVPAITYDPELPIMHLVEVDNLFFNLTGESSRLRLSTITGPLGAEVLTLGTAYTASSNQWASSDLTTFGLGQQLDSFFGIMLNDSRIQNVVFRNGSIWCTHNVFLPASFPNHGAVQWWQLSPAGGSLQFGRIEDSSGLVSYAFPSIAVNRNQDALIGFTRFSPFEYPSAAYSLLSCSDPLNTFRTDTVYKAGEAPYETFFSFTNIFFFATTWGSYSSTVVDPSNDFDLWTIQEYAATPTNFVDRWGTWWAKVTPVETCLRLEFASTEYFVNESTPGFATISVLNLGGSAGTVDFTTSDGTALAGEDYLARAGTITFAAGQTETNFIVVILDNALVNSNKSFNLTLSNPVGLAVLGRISEAVVTIEDDETIIQASQAGEFNFSSYLNNGLFYLASEYESFIYPCGNAPYVILNPPERSARGVLVTVVRTNGSSGRVLIDYETAEGGTAIPFLDYTPASGTLVFDDHQMSTNIFVEVFPNGFFSQNVTRFVRLALRNPRPAPEEEVERPGVIRPKLGLGADSGIVVYDVSRGSFFSGNIGGGGGVIVSGITNLFFSFERRNWRIDEYQTANQLGGYRIFNIQVLNPSAEAGRVLLRTRQHPDGGGWGEFIISPTVLQAGSDFAEAPSQGGLIGTEVWANPFFSDPALTTITNISDYLATNVVLEFAENECRKNVMLVLTNDPGVEFNEDIILFLTQIVGERPVHPIGRIAGVTILFNDEPAGAGDREWNVAGLPSSDPPNNLLPGADGTVRGLAVQPDGKTVLVGDFAHVNAVRRPGVARMGTNGVLDRTFDPGVGADSFVTSVALYPTNSLFGGRILIAGGFSSYNGSQRNGIARLLENGQLDTSFAPGDGANGPIWSMTLQSDGKIVIVGSFTDFNSYARNGVARLNADGSMDTGFFDEPGAGPDGVAYAVEVSRDLSTGVESIIIGGDFTFFSGEFSKGVVSLNPDGTFNTAFNVGNGVDGFVNSLAVQADNFVVIAGFFSEVNLKRRINIARLNPDGTLDASFDSGFGPDGQILAVTLDNFGKALVGGPFTSYNGTRRMGLARLRLDGTLDTSFLDTGYNQFAGFIKTYSFDPPNFVAAIALQPDGNVMVGGSFTNVGGNPSIRAPLRNAWTVFTRADKQVRWNIARLHGGATPGPGNAEFDTDEYFVNENASIASVQLQRSDGRLGSLFALATTTERTASGGVDYVSTNLFNTWREAYTLPPLGTANAPVSVGQVRDVFFRVPILNDLLQEGDEIIDMSFLRPDASITLGGEYIPLGGALGRYKATLNIGDDDVNRGVFNFAAINFSTNEVARNIRVSVTRTNGSVGTVSVDYFTRNSTNTPIATPNSDYTSVSPKRTLFFGPGETNKFIDIQVFPDGIVEFDENFELVLTNATGGARLPGGLSTAVATTTLTIIDSDFTSGRLNFSGVTYTTNENAGFATIQVTRTGGSVGSVSVQYTTANGTATAPADYITTAGTLSWGSLEQGPKNIFVPLNADGVVDSDLTRFESVNIRLFNPIIGTAPNPTLLGNRTNAVLQIEDSDSYGTLSFNQSFYQADENGGTATVTVVRKGGIAGTVSVNISVTAVDPISPGLDFVPATSTLTLLPGETSASFSVTVLDDTQTDGNKDLILTISNPVNAILGTPNPVNLTIIDNESFAIPAGQNDLTFATNTIVNGPVYSLALQPEGRILMVGDFTEVNNVPRARVARLLPGGALDPSFDPGAGPNNSVRAMALQPDSKILLGGFFTQYKGTNRPSLVRLLSDGSVDSFFNPGAGANNPVYALALLPSDKILVGGAFSTFNSISRPGLVRLNTNGIVDATFNPGSGGAGDSITVYAIGLQNDGKIVAGGEFTMFGGQTRTRIVRLNSNGSLDPAFNPAAAFDGAVRAIVIQADGRIVVGGSFTIANGVPRNRMARLNGDGSLDASFMPSPLVGADGPVFALAQQINGKIIVAGDFQTFNGVTRRRLTRLNTDGTTDPTINFGNGADGFVSSLAIQPDRKIVFGGGFQTYDDIPRQRIARIHGGSVSGPGTLEFVSTAFQVQENVTNAVITIRRREGTTGPVGVNYQTSDGTAQAGSEYETTAGTAVFSEGETRFSFTVPVIDNSMPNGDTFLRLDLLGGTYTGGATNGPDPISLLFIQDDEGGIGFTSADFAVGENVASLSATIFVRRTGGTNTLATVDYATGGGNAAPFTDYIPTNGVLTFLPGETLKQFNVRVLNDINVELNETIGLTLSNPSGSNTLNTAAATLLIIEDDFAFGQFVFNAPSYNVGENATNVFLTVLRTNGNTGVATVQYRTTDNTAIGGSDFVSTNNVLAFADGETAKTIQIPVIEDLLVESIELFNVVLFNPTGGSTLGSLSNAVVTITDNDISAIIPAGFSLVSESLTNNGIIDVNETVAMVFALRNVGSGNTANLLATLLPGNGVSLPSPATNYGVLLANGPAVGRQFSFRAVGNSGDRVVATLLLTDGGVTNGFATFPFTIGGQAVRTFSNTNRITINDDAPANPYPSTVDVASMGGTITGVTVTLANFTHDWPSDVDVLLVGPAGERVTLMSDAGTNQAVANVTMSFSDTATNTLPLLSKLLARTYLPANYAAPGLNTSDRFPAPAPQPIPVTDPFPYTNTSLSVFNDTSPNGTWSLYVMDDTSGKIGSIGGWSLNIQTSDPVSPASGVSIADIAVTASVPSASVVVGANSATTLTVTNRGPAAAINVALLDQMAPGLVVVSATPSVGTWSKVQNTLTWTIGTLPSGGSASITLVTRPQTVGALISSVTASANQTDLNTANNAVTLTTIGITVPALTIARLNNVLSLAWPANSSFKLQVADTLVPANWVDVGNVPQVNGAGQNVVSVGVAGNNKFYRLRAP